MVERRVSDRKVAVARFNSRAGKYLVDFDEQKQCIFLPLKFSQEVVSECARRQLVFLRAIRFASAWRFVPFPIEFVFVLALFFRILRFREICIKIYNFDTQGRYATKGNLASGNKMIAILFQHLSF